MRTRLHRKIQGSNQFKPKRLILSLRPKTWLAIIVVILTTAILVTPGYLTAQYQKKLTAIAQSATLIKVVYAEEALPENQTPTQKEIIGYIREVFGDDAAKAFKLLSCENSSLNPSAVNTAGNTPKGSRDVGVFQINEYWQKVQYKFLLNWKVNIEIAHQIYTDNGSFDRWTCGRKLGI